jgi:hypothetical protein
MRKSAAKILIIGILLIICVWVLAPFSSLPAQAQASRGIDFILIIDNSGSMSDNDPQGLRWSAAQLFVDLASPGDRIAAFAFATDVIPLGDAANGSLSVVSDTASRQTIKSHLSPRDPTSNTNMEGALQAALDLLQKEYSGNKQIVVFLTDGRPTPESQIPNLKNLVQQAGDRKVAIFPILLGHSTDEDIARQMVNTTGGLSQKVLDQYGLLQSFGKIYTFVRPESYAEVISINSSSLSFRTNPDQAITQLSIAVPRANENQQAVVSGSLDQVKFYPDNMLGGGTEAILSESIHYQLVTLKNNSPLSGEWNLISGTEASGIGLLIAESAITLDIKYPLPQVAGSFVAPRVVPISKPVFLVARMFQNGIEKGDVPLSITIGNSGIVTMNTSGISSNHSLEWATVDMGLTNPGDQAHASVQAGGEVAPFRLYKDFVVEAADVPPIVIDSPTPTNDGLMANGNINIAAHFEGEKVDNPQVVAFVHDLQEDSVVELTLDCQNSECSNSQFKPDSGHSYGIIVLANAHYQGQLFSDGDRTELITDGMISIHGLDTLDDIRVFAPGENPPPIDLQVAAFIESGQPSLSIEITNLQPIPAGFNTSNLAAALSPLESDSQGSYTSRLSLVGFEGLPPGAYQATFQITENLLEDVVVHPAAIDYQFEITQPKADLDLPNPIDFGIIPDLQQPQEVPLQVVFKGGFPFEITAQVAELISSRGKENTNLINIDLGPVTETSGTNAHQIALRLSALQALKPGEYRGRVTFAPANPANPAKVEPGDRDFVFSVPAPSLIMTHIGNPDSPVGCPNLGRPPRPPEDIGFGVFVFPFQPMKVDIFYQGQWLADLPSIDASILSLRRQGGDRGPAIPINIKTGTLQKSTDGDMVLPVIIEPPPRLAAGVYSGELLLNAPGVIVQPEKYSFRLVSRPGVISVVRRWLRPVYCTAIDYYWPWPLRFKSIAAWLITLIIFIILCAILCPKTTGWIEPNRGRRKRITPRRPLYVIRKNGQIVLSSNQRDSVNVIVDNSLHAPDQAAVDPVSRSTARSRRAGRTGRRPRRSRLSNKPYVLVKPGPGSRKQKTLVVYYSKKKKTYYKLKESGKKLFHDDHYLVIENKTRHRYKIQL